ncbi:MAG: Ppx/GppA family phosphatase [Muribaculaceae bacterium]|nr:Ppx/GppA family phosphatase [Muribaculaceae bacterium]
MKPHTYAAIDIGTNAVRLLIKKEDPDTDVPELKLKKQLLVRVPLRLGFDVFANGEVSAVNAEKLVRLMKAYRELMTIYEVDRVRTVATSAMRDASNGRELLGKIKNESDTDIEIISGEEAARIIYNNHLERRGNVRGSFLYVDVGGGSTEINFIDNGKLAASRSYNIGTVRALTGKIRPCEKEAMHSFLDSIAECHPDISIIGSGGNINKLYKMACVKDKETRSLPVSELLKLYNTLEPLSVEQRIDRYGLRADRADVIIPAAKIFLAIASTLSADRIIVPTIGIADGIIDGLYLADLSKRDGLQQRE